MIAKKNKDFEFIEKRLKKYIKNIFEDFGRQKDRFAFQKMKTLVL